MRSLGIKKFSIDYIIGFGLIFLLFYLLFGKMTVMDTRGNLQLAQACSSPLSEEDILQKVRESLRTGERCEVVPLCVDWYSLQCEGTVQLSALHKTILGRDLLIFRVNNSLVDTYGFMGYKDSSTFRIPLSFILLLVAYGLVLAEAGAILFALWRQEKLRQTLTLPSGSKKDQLLKPALFAIPFAIVVVLANHLAFKLFEHPEVESREIISTLLNSASGVFIIVILAPLAEELIFRGVLLRFFVEKKKLLLGTVLVSLLFAGFHGFAEQSPGWQLYLSSIYFLLSAFLCSVYITQKNIWSPIVFHVVYNGTMVVLYSLFV